MSLINTIGLSLRDCDCITTVKQVDFATLNLSKSGLYVDNTEFTTPLKDDVFVRKIIPMILVNGAQGIGTGFSTKVPPYNPIEIITNLKNIINVYWNEDDYYLYFREIGNKIRVRTKQG